MGCGSLNSATNWVVIHLYLNPSGSKFTNYDNWTKSWDLQKPDWLRYIARNHQSQKSKELTCFPYTCVNQCMPKRLLVVLSPWSLTPVRWSITVVISPSINPIPEESTVQRAYISSGGGLHLMAPLSLLILHQNAPNDTLSYYLHSGTCYSRV